jgi:hypothetical protein
MMIQFVLTLFLLASMACGIPGGSPIPGQAADQASRKEFERWKRKALDGSPATRREAAQALRRFPKRALPTLLKLLQDRDGGVRLAAAKTVRTIVSRPWINFVPAHRSVVLSLLGRGRAPY